MELDYQKIDFDLPKSKSNVIKVIGVGGGCGTLHISFRHQEFDFIVNRCSSLTK